MIATKSSGKGDSSEISDRLLEWFEDAQRRFPWRETGDPYAVLVAEKLLQQTVARDSVIEVYRDLLDAYPTVDALAEANVENVLGIIHPLGLHYRAKELVTLAQLIHNKCDGRIPQELDSLLALPGVGDYISRAVLCFAFGKKVPVVDTNVARILHRVLGLSDPIPSNPSRKKSLIELSKALLPDSQSREFNLALLDLGALICTPANAKHEECPLVQICEYAIQLQKGEKNG